jgi:predicted MFS family arabinose efflux permease
MAPVTGEQSDIRRAALRFIVLMGFVSLTASMVGPERRGTAYGMFNAFSGLSRFAGSLLLGLLYDRSLPALIVVSVLLQPAALPLLLWVRRRSVVG